MEVIKCKQCKTEITGGFYNTPRGIFCPECWEQKSPAVKRKAYSDTLKQLALLGKTVNK